MNQREQQQMLKSAGFWFKRNGTRHALWTNGVRDIAISHGGGVSPRTLKSFKSLIRKYRERMQAQPQ